MHHLYLASQRRYQLHEKRARKRQIRQRVLRHYRQLYYLTVVFKQARGRNGKRYARLTFHEFRDRVRNKTVVRHSEIIQFWHSRRYKINRKGLPSILKGHLYVPKVFSLSDEEHQAESFRFINRLFAVLHKQQVVNLYIDYEHCERIDVDASVCMDVLLQNFIRYFNECTRERVHRHLQEITPVNIKNGAVAEVLFSVGGMSLLGNINLQFPDVIPLHLQIGDRKDRNSSEYRDLEITKIVDYVVGCLSMMNHELTSTAETQLYKVVGEVLINASEHATTDLRYSVGYFKKQPQNDDVLGVLQLVIMNFGDSIYEKFKDPACPNQEVVQQMNDLSEAYTKKQWFSKAEFEEETLWTLYALQDGVTSHKDWLRGNGSIRFINSFFGLKGNTEFDDLSRMTILSGNTRIIFDGTYQVQTQQVKRGNKVLQHKIMPFNRSGSIKEQPDKKFVKFVPDYFPGTMLSAKICIKPGNTAPIQQPNQ